MKIKQKKEVLVDAKVLKIYMKVRDEFCAEIVDQDDEQVFSYEGYVPGFMPGEHHGDYLILDIEIDTGKILNWSPPTDTQMEEFIGQND